MKILTWNVLYPDLATPTRYPFCEPQYLLWSYRQSLIESVIAKHQADVVCLQEVDGTDVVNQWVIPMERLGYTSLVSLQKTKRKQILKWCSAICDTQKPSKPNARINVTFVKSDVFEITSEIGGSRHVTTKLRELRDLHNLRNEKEITVCNLHLPARATSDVIIHSLSQIISKLDAPTVLCGDFNTEIEPGDATYRFLTAQGFVNAYEITESKHAPVATYISQRRYQVLDHVFVKGMDRVTNVECPIVPQGTLIPSETQPSDHLPVLICLV